MNIQTKYSLYQRVFYIKSSEAGIGKIEICSGNIEKIFTQAYRDRKGEDVIEIHYCYCKGRKK